MYWHSLADFFAMGKHGVYVWGSFAVMALAMIIEPVLLVRARRQLVARLRRQWRAENTHAGKSRRMPAHPSASANSEATR